MARENWTSSFGFILASAGSAIGLGNIWKFPYVAGENGGGTFVLVYVLCVLFVGLPVMCAEMVIGRHTHRNVINAMGKVEALSPRSPVRYVLSALALALAGVLFSMQAWVLGIVAIGGAVAFAMKGFSALGWVCTAIALAILSYYAVVGGWIVDYIWRAVSGSLCLTGESAAQAAQASSAIFADYTADPWRVLIGFCVFMALTGAMIWSGIQAGIERISKVLMPLLFLLLLVVLVRGVTLPGAWDGVVFLFKPTSAAFTPKVVLMAMGQAFFSLSLGMAITVTYGSYLHRDQNILKSAGWVGVLDTLAALLAGLAIFPAVFAVGLSPSAGPGLIFGALPATFSAMPWGNFWAACFFIMLFIAAVTSSASLLECGATVFIERVRRGHQRGSRKAAVVWGFVLCTVLGLLSVFSTANWSFLPSVERAMDVAFGTLKLGSWFDTLDNFASYWVLPFTALGITLLVGWVWTPRRASRELPAQGETPRVVLLRVWGFLVRYLAPIAIVCIFLNSTGLVSFGSRSANEPPAEQKEP